jgi:uncharacterized protein (DUF2141 family)
MKSFIRHTILLICGISSSALAADLEITISELSAATGKLSVKLVDSADAYNGPAKPVAGKQLEVSSTDALKLSFADLKPGNYAVMVMHDENSNGKLDSNILGIPKEGYGFSNNPNVMRQPTFEEARFEVKDGSNQITIELR